MVSHLYLQSRSEEGSHRQMSAGKVGNRNERRLRVQPSPSCVPLLTEAQTCFSAMRTEQSKHDNKR